MESWSKYAKTYDPIKCASIDGTDCDPHDKAVLRALNATYNPNRFVKGRPECTIFVSRLNHETTKETIKEIFSKYGKLKRFRIIKDIVTGMSKGYAFVEYEEEQGAEEAYRLANKMLVDERHIFVDFECERLLKGWKPRRLGGGFGGKKESGQLRFGGRDRPFKKPIALEMKEKKEKRQREEEERRRRVRHEIKSSSRAKRKSTSKERKRPKSPPRERNRSKDRPKQSSESKPLRKKSPVKSKGDAQSSKSRADDQHHLPPRQNNGSSPQRNRKNYSSYKSEEKKCPPPLRIDNKPMHKRSRRESPLGRSSPKMRSRSPISNHESNYRGQSSRDHHESNYGGQSSRDHHESNYGGQSSRDYHESNYGGQSSREHHDNNYGDQSSRDRQENNYRAQPSRDHHENNYGGQSSRDHHENNYGGQSSRDHHESVNRGQSPREHHENSYRGQSARESHENNYRGQSPMDHNQSRPFYNNDNSVYESYLPPNVNFQHPPPVIDNGPHEYNGEPRREFAARDLRQEDYRARDQHFSPEQSNYPPLRRNFAPAPVRGRGRGRGGPNIPYQRGGFQRY